MTSFNNKTNNATATTTTVSQYTPENGMLKIRVNANFSAMHEKNKRQGFKGNLLCYLYSVNKNDNRDWCGVVKYGNDTGVWMEFLPFESEEMTPIDCCNLNAKKVTVINGVNYYPGDVNYIEAFANEVAEEKWVPLPKEALEMYSQKYWVDPNTAQVVLNSNLDPDQGKVFRKAYQKGLHKGEKTKGLTLWLLPEYEASPYKDGKVKIRFRLAKVEIGNAFYYKNGKLTQEQKGAMHTSMLEFIELASKPKAKVDKANPLAEIEEKADNNSYEGYLKKKPITHGNKKYKGVVKTHVRMLNEFPEETKEIAFKCLLDMLINVKKFKLEDLKGEISITLYKELEQLYVKTTTTTTTSMEEVVTIAKEKEIDF